MTGALGPWDTLPEPTRPPSTFGADLWAHVMAFFLHFLPLGGRAGLSCLGSNLCPPIY